MAKCDGDQSGKFSLHGLVVRRARLVAPELSKRLAVPHRQLVELGEVPIHEDDLTHEIRRQVTNTLRNTVTHACRQREIHRNAVGLSDFPERGEIF